MERRLAAILAADVVGYSRLVEADEDGTLAAFKSLRVGFVEPLIAEYRGRVVKLMGDGFLVEFQSAVDAVKCAVDWQSLIHEQDHADALEFRIGINLGDIVIDGNDIFGDGVNVAARLEGLAEPGSIVISDMVYQSIRAKIGVAFSDIGEQSLKNIDHPVRVWQWSERSRSSPGVKRPESPKLPDKPSIAVLPFQNMSGDPEQEYFSDGITEDIITELSRFPILYVIARQSAFALKGEKLGVQEIGAKLGVEYVVEGSVRRAGNKARMTAQLVEADSGNHIWAERYDRELEDIFEVQDEVTQSIVAAVAAQLGKTVSEKSARKPTSSIRSYEFFLQGNRHYYQFRPDENVTAAKLYQKAIEHDPMFARAYAGLANAYCTDYFLDWRRTDNALQNGFDCAQKCLELDATDALGRIILSWALIGFRRWDEAELELDRVLSQKPGDADLLAELGHGLYVVGRYEIGLSSLEEAVRLNPLFPDVYRRWLGIGYYHAGRYQDAATALRAARLEGWGYAFLAASFARLGEFELAHEALSKFLELRKAELASAGASVRSTEDLLGSYRNNYRHDKKWKHFLDGLRKAGFKA